jgi:hypothetical protein
MPDRPTDKVLLMPTINEQLLGTWRLVSYYIEGVDGSVVYPMGQEAVGFIMYLPDGFMSANLMVPGRSPYTGGMAGTATQAELAVAASGYFGYAGRYEVDEATKGVRHHIEIALAPNLVGSSQFRHVRFEGRRLMLRGDPTSIGGRMAAHVITWERCASDAPGLASQ